jgi:hypothetical protein
MGTSLVRKISRLLYRKAQLKLFIVAPGSSFTSCKMQHVCNTKHCSACHAADVTGAPCAMLLVLRICKIILKYYVNSTEVIPSILAAEQDFLLVGE